MVSEQATWVGVLFARQPWPVARGPRMAGRVLRNDIRLGSANPTKSGAHHPTADPSGALVFSVRRQTVSVWRGPTNGEALVVLDFPSQEKVFDSPQVPRPGTPKGTDWVFTLDGRSVIGSRGVRAARFFVQDLARGVSRVSSQNTLMKLPRVAISPNGEMVATGRRLHGNGHQALGKFPRFARSASCSGPQALDYIA